MLIWFDSFEECAIPSLHHRKEGWSSDQETIAKHPLISEDEVVFR
jgi:hypothetical protein